VELGSWSLIQEAINWNPTLLTGNINPPGTPLPAPDLSNVDGFHRAAATGHLAEIIFRLAGGPPPEPELELEPLRLSDIRDWFVVARWSLRERYRRVTRVGAYQFEPGTYAEVTFGPSAGTVVRLVRMAYAPPGCDGCAIHTLQPHGPIWVVDQFLEWDVWSKAQKREVRYRFTTAPWTALRAVAGQHRVWRAVRAPLR
jgi:hypothetical protein